MPRTDERVRKYLEAGGVLGEVVRARTAELVRELGRSVDAVTSHVSDVLTRSADLGRRTTRGVVGKVASRRTAEPPGVPPERAVC